MTDKPTWVGPRTIDAAVTESMRVNGHGLKLSEAVETKAAMEVIARHVDRVLKRPAEPPLL